MREGVIDLDYLDSEIEKLKGDIEKSKKVKGTYPAYVLFQAGLKTMEDIRSKCTPIQEQTINGYVVTKGEWTNATIEDHKLNYFLSKTCINDWESNKYCSNQNKCQMCKIKQ